MTKFYETEIGHRTLREEFWPQELKQYRKAEDNYLLKVVKPNSIILDVGCGEGMHLKLLAKISKKLFGIDYSKSMLEIARRELSNFNNVELFLEEANKTHFQNNYFDYSICMFNTFGNIPPPEQKSVLDELKRITKKDGKIIISVYSENALEVQKEFYRNIGLEIIKIDDNFVYTNQDFISERFTKEKLERLFAFVNLKAKIIQLTPISYVCEIDNS